MRVAASTKQPALVHVGAGGVVTVPVVNTFIAHDPPHVLLASPPQATEHEDAEVTRPVAPLFCSEFPQ